MTRRTAESPNHLLLGIISNVHAKFSRVSPAECEKTVQLQSHLLSFVEKSVVMAGGLQLHGVPAKECVLSIQFRASQAVEHRLAPIRCDPTRKGDRQPGVNLFRSHRLEVRRWAHTSSRR